MPALRGGHASCQGGPAGQAQALTAASADRLCLLLFLPPTASQQPACPAACPSSPPKLTQGKDCYLFELDDEWVLDSTRAGAMCRFTVRRGDSWGWVVAHWIG